MGKLDNLNQQVRNCRLCRLCRLRENGVPGEGSESAEVLFIGEGPGFNEDREGRPFVGAAGQFLDELLGIAGLQRPAVYITNVVKCRPPQNRDPLPDEIDACAPYLERQIATINPLLIVTLGRFSMARFFPDDKISSVHGKAREIEGRIVMTMWHPAFGLRSPEGRESIKEDFRKLPAALEQARAVRARRPVATAHPLPDLAALVAQHLETAAEPVPLVPRPEAAPREQEDGFAYLEAVTSQMRKPAGRRKRSEVAAAEVVTVPVVTATLNVSAPEAVAPAASVVIDEAPASYTAAPVEEAAATATLAPVEAATPPDSGAALVAPPADPPVEAPAPARKPRRPKADAAAPPVDVASGTPDASIEGESAAPPEDAPADSPAKARKKGKAEPDFQQLSLFE